MTEIEVGQEDRQFSRNFKRNDRSSSGSSLGSRRSANRDKIRYWKYREYDHFATDCSNMKGVEKDQSYQMQQLMDTKERTVH